MPPAKPDRRPLISGNWKMHHNHLEAIQGVQKLSYQVGREDYDVLDVSVHPPFTALRSVQTVLDADKIPIALGAQHRHWEETGASTDDAQTTIATVRGGVGSLHNAATANALRIQYGGSVKPDNITELMAMPDIDGALVGGASLDPDDFGAIVRGARPA